MDAAAAQLHVDVSAAGPVIREAVAQVLAEHTVVEEVDAQRVCIGEYEGFVLVTPKKRTRWFNDVIATQPAETLGRGDLRIGHLIVSQVDECEEAMGEEALPLEERRRGENAFHQFCRNISDAVNTAPRNKLGKYVHITPSMVANRLDQADKAIRAHYTHVGFVYLPVREARYAGTHLGLFEIRHGETPRALRPDVITRCLRLGSYAATENLFRLPTGRKARPTTAERLAQIGAKTAPTDPRALHAAAQRVAARAALIARGRRFPSRDEIEAEILRSGQCPNPGPSPFGRGDAAKRRRDKKEKGKARAAASIANAVPAVRMPTRESMRAGAIAASAREAAAEAEGAADAAKELAGQPPAEVVVAPARKEPENPFVTSGFVRYRHGNIEASEASVLSTSFQLPFTACKQLFFTITGTQVAASQVVEKGKLVMTDGRLPQHRDVPLAPGQYDSIRAHVVVSHITPFDYAEPQYEHELDILLPYQYLLEQSRRMVGASCQDFPTVLRRTDSVLAHYYPDPSEQLLDHGDERVRWLVASALLYLSPVAISEDVGWVNFLWTNVASMGWTRIEKSVIKVIDRHHRLAPGYYLTSTDAGMKNLAGTALRAGAKLRFVKGKKGKTGPEELEDINSSRARVNSLFPLVRDTLGALVAPTTPLGVEAAFHKRLGREVAPVDPRALPLLQAVSGWLAAPLSPPRTWPPQEIVERVTAGGAFVAWSFADLLEKEQAAKDFISGEFTTFMGQLPTASSILKNETLNPDVQKPARFVISPSAYVRAYSAFLLYTSTQSLVHNSRLSSLMIKGLTEEQIQARVMDRLGAWMMCDSTVTTDITSMESQMRACYLDLEGRAYMSAAASEYRQRVGDYFAVRAGLPISAAGRGYVIRFGPCRISGTQETSVGNCLGNATWQVAAELMANRLSDGAELFTLPTEEEMQSTRAMKGLYEGDDGIRPLVPNPDQYVYVVREILGIDFKLDTEHKFCGTSYIFAMPGKILSIVDPRPVIAKLGMMWSAADTTRGDELHLVAKAMSYLRRYGHIPCIRKICDAVLSAHAAARRRVEELVAGPGAADFLRKVGFDTYHPFTRHDVQPWSPEQDAKVEELISQYFKVPSAAQHQLADQICAAVHELAKRVRAIEIPSICPLLTQGKVIVEQVLDARVEAHQAQWRHVSNWVIAKAGAAGQRCSAASTIALARVWVTLLALLAAVMAHPLGALVLSAGAGACLGFLALGAMLLLKRPLAQAIGGAICAVLLPPIAALAFVAWGIVRAAQGFRRLVLLRIFRSLKDRLSGIWERDQAWLRSVFHRAPRTQHPTFELRPVRRPPIPTRPLPPLPPKAVRAAAKVRNSFRTAWDRVPTGKTAARAVHKVIRALDKRVSEALSPPEFLDS